ncbi:hypothetical protein [Streptomyces sp. KAU_LT]|uniref:hypothetical protein n=1 Tax=Streptomyces sp. KAU_LT TaxID=3046669 RepID=UPI0024B7EFB3|nr:hypothetical protein [Streptomyces sp. KAU_LT]MDI9832768.1 hypothetical protein [Streptomyces sp. KAU_LT]
MTFLVVVEGDAGGWHIDRDALTEVFRTRWPEVVVDASHRSAVRSLVWEFDTVNGPGEAYLHEGGTCLYVDAWEDDAIWLATAFRGLGPPHLDMVLCDDGYTFDVRLHAGTTVGELTALVRAAG